MRALYTAATGMNAQQVRTDSIANNIANASTVGFKKARPEFQDLFYETLSAPGATSADGATLPSGVQVGHGVKLASMTRVFTDGDRVATGRDLDLAIQGEGFIQVQKPGGETVYTRSGNLQLDRDGGLATVEGYQIVPALTIPTDALQITILADGTVSVLQAGSTTPTDVGQLQLARFTNPTGMRALGGNYYAPTEASGDPETGTPDSNGFGAVGQGFLENSNVDVADELVQLILAQRAFEMNSRVIEAGDQMMQRMGTLGR